VDLCDDISQFKGVPSQACKEEQTNLNFGRRGPNQSLRALTNFSSANSHLNGKPTLKSSSETLILVADLLFLSLSLSSLLSLTMSPTASSSYVCWPIGVHPAAQHLDRTTMVGMDRDHWRCPAHP